MVLQELRGSLGEPADPILGTDRVSLSKLAYEQIRRKIVSLDMPPGSIIDESRLQNELGLGRTPIREALLRLSFEKLVTIQPRRGIFVAEIGITDLQEIFEIRISLEALAARLAAQRGNERHWSQIDAILGKISALDAGDREELTALDEACHRVVYDAASNEFLQDTLNTLYALSHRLWRYLSVKPEGVLSEHQAILSALRAKDAHRACDLVEQHIRSFQESIQAAVLGGPLPGGTH